MLPTSQSSYKRLLACVVTSIILVATIASKALPLNTDWHNVAVSVGADRLSVRDFEPEEWIPVANTTGDQIFLRRAPSELPICQKTLLYTIAASQGRKTHGFFSEMNSLLRFALWARLHNCWFIIESGFVSCCTDTFFVETQKGWNYGFYADYFSAPEADCVLDESSVARQRISVQDVTGSHLQAFHREYVEVPQAIETQRVCSRRIVDDFLVRLVSKGQAGTPTVSQARPGMSTAELRAHWLLHTEAKRLWLPMAELSDLSSRLREELREIYKKRPQIIGVHYRAGDKHLECGEGTVCAGAEQHLRTAVRALQTLPAASCSNCKPVLLIMTIEPGVKALFERHPLASSFDVRLLPPPSTGFIGHSQKPFNRLSLEKRKELTRIMLRDLEFLATAADAFVVSASSNIGRFALALGGPDRQILSADVGFVVTTKPM